MMDILILNGIKRLKMETFDEHYIKKSYTNDEEKYIQLENKLNKLNNAYKNPDNNMSNIAEEIINLSE